MGKEIDFNEKIKSICQQVYDNNKQDDEIDGEETWRNKFVNEVVIMIGEALQLYDDYNSKDNN